MIVDDDAITVPLRKVYLLAKKYERRGLLVGWLFGVACGFGVAAALFH